MPRGRGDDDPDVRRGSTARDARRRGARDALRLAAATGLVALWMLLLLFGHPLGAAVHLLLAAALATVPWRLVHP